MKRGKVGAELLDRCEDESLNVLTPRGVDIRLPVIDEKCFVRRRFQLFEQVAIDLGLGFHPASFRREYLNVKMAKPRGVFSEMIREALVQIREQRELVVRRTQMLHPSEHR